MHSLLKLVRLILIAGVLSFIAVIAGGIGLIYWFSRDLPKLDSLKDYNPPTVSEVFDTNGIKIGEFWTEKRFVLQPKEIPKTVIQAIVASEDDRFFEHKGIDYPGIVRAFFENLKAGHVVQGGSTITQQVTKSLLLSSERTFSRKIKEAILATQIEKNFNKDEILYLYLNQIFLGNRAYGVEAAARNYFHKAAKELNIAEAAMIAGLAKAPTAYSPLKDPAQAKIRQEYVIQRMYEVGYITKSQETEAKNFPLKVYREDTDKDFNYRYTPWFTEYVRRLIQEKYGDTAPYTQGLRIDTAVDLKMQQAADAAMDRGLRELDKREGYSGPIRHINSNDFKTYTDASHLQILENEPDNGFIVQQPPSKESKLKTPTPLHDNQYYEALITGLDSKEQFLEISVGHVQGFIKMQDYCWVHKRNLSGAGYDGMCVTRDPKGTFSVGDIVSVKLKKPTEEETKSKGYAPDKTYFSLEQRPAVEGAFFSYEPQTGFVKAIVGGKDYKESEFNRAMQALRQTGSSIKPLIYAAALDKGYTPETSIEDSPLYYEYSPGKFWSPSNYGGGYKGPTSFRSGLVNSRNVVTVRILMDIGTDYVTAYGRKLGLSAPIQRYYSMALGSNDMKLFEVCRAYGTFVTGGIRPDLVFVKRITDHTGRVLEEHHPRAIVPFTEQLSGKKEKDNKDISIRDDLYQEAQNWIKSEKLNLSDSEKKILYGNYIPEGYTISPKTAYTMVQLMHDVVNYGTGFKVKALGRPAAGKTGTTNDETDVWFVGFVPNLFAGVWIGFDQAQKIGSRETGGTTAAPVFLYYMQQVLKDKPVAQFVIPPEINAEALKAPLDIEEGDAEAGGSTGNIPDFIIHDF